MRSSGTSKATSAGVHYVRRNFDEVAILAVATKLAFESGAKFSDSEQATIAAMQRAHPQAGETPEQLGEWLAEMAPEQIAGVVNNTKGVLHEMEFVRLENEDGDSVHAALFESTSHPDFDVRFVDDKTGAHWDAQLKASDDASYVQGWIDDHPDGQIQVTEELADAMGVPSSGIRNEELTVSTEDVVDRLVDATDEDSMWDYFPTLTAVSLGLVVWGLWRRLRQGEISMARFKGLVARATGLKASKLALLTLAMSIPGLNVVTGAALAARLILVGLSAGRSSAARMPLSALLPRSAEATR